MKIWVSTYVDSGETCDGKARVLGIDATKEAATARVKADIEQWAAYHGSDSAKVDPGRMSARYESGRCEWNIEEAEL